MSAVITSEDKLNYFVSTSRTETALTRSIVLLKRRLYTPDITEAEESLIDVEMPEVYGKRAKVTANKLAFLEGKIQINPPTDAQVSQIKQLTESIAQMTAQVTIARNIIKTATKVFKAWNGMS